MLSLQIFFLFLSLKIVFVLANSVDPGEKSSLFTKVRIIESLVYIRLAGIFDVHICLKDTSSR